MSLKVEYTLHMLKCIDFKGIIQRALASVCVYSATIQIMIQNMSITQEFLSYPFPHCHSSSHTRFLPSQISFACSWTYYKWNMQDVLFMNGFFYTTQCLEIHPCICAFVMISGSSFLPKQTWHYLLDDGILALFQVHLCQMCLVVR